MKGINPHTNSTVADTRGARAKVDSTIGVGVNTIGIYTFIRREVERVLRIVIQTLLSPLISATLFIFIFGSVLGKKIDLIAGVPCIPWYFGDERINFSF
jgi:hypothetical protein